jgi:hypothetical protein
MLDLLRRFVGPRVEVIGPPIMGRARRRNTCCPANCRGDVSAIIFPSELLELPSLRSRVPDDPGIVEIETPVPEPRDINEMRRAPYQAGPARSQSAR